MAWAIISGLLASTVLTLLVVPAVYRLSLKKVPDKLSSQDATAVARLAPLSGGPR